MRPYSAKGWQSFPGIAWKGFTLAELLIALAILGVIATFTIPKLITNQQSAQNNAKAHEFAAMMSAAHQLAKLDGSLTNTMTGDSFSPYLNYVSVVTDGTQIDERPNYGFSVDSCTGNSVCYRLHNGALFKNYSGAFSANVGGNCPNGRVEFTFDPDGAYTGKRDSVRMTLSYEGRAGSRTYACNGSADLADDPPWFSW